MQFTVKELRARKNWTQKEVAEKLGIAYQTYNYWENNVPLLSVKKIKALAKLFDVSLNDIFID